MNANLVTAAWIQRHPGQASYLPLRVRRAIVRSRSKRYAVYAYDPHKVRRVRRRFPLELFGILHDAHTSQQPITIPVTKVEEPAVVMPLNTSVPEPQPHPRPAHACSISLEEAEIGLEHELELLPAGKPVEKATLPVREAIVPAPKRLVYVHLLDRIAAWFKRTFVFLSRAD